MKMGFAQADITPVGKSETIGFGRADEMSRGVLDSLYAQVAVWKNDGEICCTVSIDHIGFSKQHADMLRDSLAGILAVGREKVMLFFSHCHSAPNDSTNKGYFDFVCERIRNALFNAISEMCEAKAAWGNGFCDIGVNRRKGCDALDRRIGILKIADSEGKIRLLLLRLTAHNNVLKGDNYLISADYFGAVRETLQKQYGCPVMLTQGAAGDIAPKYFCSSLTPPDACDERFIRSNTALSDMASEVLSGVSKVIDGITVKEVNNLSMHSDFFTLYCDVPSYDEALEVAAQAKKYCFIDGTAWLGEVKRLIDNSVTQQTEIAEVQYFAIAGGCLCGVPNEVMCESALEISSELQNEFIYFGGYTNGCTGYLPTEIQFDEGGYEVYWSWLIYYIYHGHVYPCRRDSLKRLTQFVNDSLSGGRFS